MGSCRVRLSLAMLCRPGPKNAKVTHALAELRTLKLILFLTLILAICRVRQPWDSLAGAGALSAKLLRISKFVEKQRGTRWFRL